MKKILTAVSAFALTGLIASSAQAKITELNIGGSIELEGTYGDNTVSGDDDVNDQTAYYELNVDLDFKGKASENVEFVIKTEWKDLTEHDGAEGLQLEESYVKLKEFGFKPLTLTAGLTEPAFSLRGDDEATSFDGYLMGLTADLDFEPVQIKVIIGTQQERDTALDTPSAIAYPTQSDDAVQAMIIDWWFGENNLVTGSILHSQVAGVRNANDPKDGDVYQYLVGADWFFGENIEVYGDLGMQDGEVNGGTDHEAFYIQLGAKYTFNGVKMTPSIDVGYKSFSGNEVTDTESKGWVMLGDHDTSIILEDELGRDEDNSFGGIDTGLEQFRILTSLSDVGLKGLDLSFNIFVNSAAGDEMVGTQVSDKMGVEYDLVADYQYSEDVSMYAAAAMMDLDENNVLVGGSDDMTVLKWGVLVNF